MWFSSWLRNKSRRAEVAQRRTSSGRRSTFRPQLETLEDRRVLTTFAVGNVSALITAIHSANNAGGSHTIVLASNASFDLKKVNNTAHGANALPVIGAAKPVDLTIIGNGDTIQRTAGYTFDRRGVPNAFRLFDVAPGASLTLDHVKLRGGWAYGSGVAGFGGAVYNQGTLNVRNGSVFVLNIASADGGVIYNAGGTVTVNGSQLLGGQEYVGNNTVVAGNSVSRNGGAIYNGGGTLVVSSSTLSGSGAFSGGGIYNAGGSVTVTNGSILSGNAARFGGGIYNVGGALTVSNSSLSSNSAFHADYPWTGGDGGGIYNSGGTVLISNSTLSGNAADAWFGSGGAVYNNGGTLTISGSNISGNTALSGGGVYNSSGTVTVKNSSTISGNQASGLDEDFYNLGVLYVDASSTIGVLKGNAGVLI